MRIVFSLLTTLLLLFLNFAVAEHHHEDHELHIDCSLCILQHNQIDNTTYEPRLSLFSIDYRPEFFHQPSQPAIKTLTKSIHSRAPPGV